MRFVALVVLCLLAAACDAVVGGVACPAVSEPALVVTIVDAATGEPAAEGALVVARDGAFADTLRASGVYDGQELVSVAGAHGRPGTYRVSVEQTGYERWERADVEVRSSGGACPQPVTVSLDARLVRAVGFATGDARH